MNGMIHGCDQSRLVEKSDQNAIVAVTAVIHRTAVQGTYYFYINMCGL